RERRGCPLGCERRSYSARCGDHVHGSANQLGRQCRQSIVLVLRPAIFDNGIAALDIARFVEPLVECHEHAGETVRGPAVEKPDHWHCRLLRPPRERPRSRRAAEQRDELTALQLIALHLVPSSQGRIVGYRIGEDQSGGNYPRKSPHASSTASARVEPLAMVAF